MLLYSTPGGDTSKVDRWDAIGGLGLIAMLAGVYWLWGVGVSLIFGGLILVGVAVAVSLRE